MNLDEPTDERDERGEPDRDACELGCSTLCTEEGAYLWEQTNQYCCAHCYSAAEAEMESRR